MPELTASLLVVMAALMVIGYVALAAAYYRHLSETSLVVAELQRWKNTANKYNHWLAEFDDVATVLENLQAEAAGELLNAGHPPTVYGPWDISGLRQVLRAKRKDGTS